MRTRTIYIALDEAEFSNEDECLAYERERPHFALVGLTLPRLASALAGEDQGLVEALRAVVAALPAMSPADEGFAAYERGEGGIIPPRYARDKLAGQEWLRGWGVAADQRGAAHDMVRAA